nr:uncharacterized protein LOC113826904 [Penaeus vannamei]
MSALEKEIASLVQDKYLMTNLGASVSKWNAEALARAYQRLLSVYDNCFDFTSSTSCVKTKLQHVQKCLRLLGIGHLAPRLDELTDTGRALRIISALDDKISAKHSVQIAAKRNRVIIKQEELRNKPAKKVLKVPAHKENLEQENVDPNIISTNPEEPIGKLPICTSSLGVVMTQNEWLIQQKADTHPTEAPKEKTITTIIPTGRQLPRTPVKPSVLPPEDADSPETLQDAETSCAIESSDQESLFLSVAPAANHIPSGRQLPRTPKAEEDFSSSDDQLEFRKSEPFLEEKSHHSIDLAKQNKTETNRRGTFVLPTPPRCQQTVALSEDSLYDSERRGTFTFPPPAGYEKKDSYSDVSVDASDRRGTFSLPSPLGNERDDDTILDRRGTYTFPPPAEFKGEDSYGEEVDNEEERSTFTLPPVGYDEESHRNVTEVEADRDRRGTYTLPPPSGYGEDDTYSAVNAPIRRGTYNVSSTEMDGGDSFDYCQDEDDDIFQKETNIREKFGGPLHSEKEERRGTCAISASSGVGDRRGTYAVSGPTDVGDRRGTYAITGPSEVGDRRGTYAISGPTDVEDRRGTYAISGPSEVRDRRGTYAISGPPDENDRRGTFTVSGLSDDSDRLGTYNLGKGPCPSEDYVGPIFSNRVKKEILVFGQDSLKAKPMGPIPDLSEFDDLPFTNELPASEVAVNDCTFQLDSVESSREVSEISGRNLDKPVNSYEEKNASHEEMPLPVISVASNSVVAQPQTARENYIPRGKQIPRTPNENDSRERSASLVNSTGSVTETTFEHSSIGSDPNFSVQIFVATPKRHQNAKLILEKKGDDAVLIEIPKDDSDVTRNKIQNNYETNSDMKVTHKVKQSPKQLQPKLVEESPRINLDANNTSKKYSATSSVDLQDKTLEDKLPNHPADSLFLKETNISDFDDSLEIFPSKTGKITMKSKNSIASNNGGASRVAESELAKINTSIMDTDRTKMGDTENETESHVSSKEEMQNKYTPHRNFSEILEDDIMHNPAGERKHIRGKRKEKTTEMSEDPAVAAHTQKKNKVRPREMKLKKSKPESENNAEKETDITEKESKMLLERKVDLKPKSTKRKQETQERSAKSCEENRLLDADHNSIIDTEHNDSNQIFLHPVKVNRQGQKDSQDDSQKKAEDTKSVKEPVELKENKTKQRKPVEDKAVKRRGRRKENVISEDCGNKIETAIPKSEKSEKQDSVEPVTEKVMNSKSDELSPIKALPRRGRIKKAVPEEIFQQITKDEENVKPAELPPSEELPESPAKRKRGRPSRRAAKDPLPKENDLELNETIPVQKGKKKSENAEEKIDKKKRSGPVSDKQAAEETEPVVQEVKETLQPEPKSKTKRHLRKKNDETVLKSPLTTSVPAKKSTKQKKTQEENADQTVIKDSIEENLLAETKKSTRRKKIQMENVAVVEEKVETPEKAKTTAARGRNGRGSKKTLGPEGELGSKNAQTHKPKGRRKKTSPDDSHMDEQQQNQATKEKEIQKHQVKAPRASRKKKNAEMSPDVSSQEVLPATGRPGRQCKVKASEAIAETLNSSDTDFLKTIRAYK